MVQKIAGRAMTLATLSRDEGQDLVLFLHGIGCVKETFAAFWEAPEFAGLALLAPDLPGHGASQGLPPETWAMEGMADVLYPMLEDRARDGRRLHVVAHSMGGAVGLLLAREIRLPLASFVSVEGNLVAEDCGMLSRRTAEMDLTLFKDAKFDRLKARARDAEDPMLRDWAGWVEACPAEAFHASAKSLVAWSDSGQLLEIFRALAVAKAYVYGEKSANPDVLARLEAIPQVRIADCGHFVMAEKPAELARVVWQVISQAE
jgi:pimeloyl-ACP methyl ester carboxylesterase